MFLSDFGQNLSKWRFSVVIVAFDNRVDMGVKGSIVKEDGGNCCQNIFRIRY